MATTITPTVQTILGNMLMELLNGQLSDDTIRAVDGINRDEVPAALVDVFNFMRGATMQPEFRQNIINHLLVELASGAEMLAKTRQENGKH